jgi:hypothetical protein
MRGPKGVDPYEFLDPKVSGDYNSVLYNVNNVEAMTDLENMTLDEIIDAMYASGLNSDEVDLTIKEFEQRRGSWN